MKTIGKAWLLLATALLMGADRPPEKLALVGGRIIPVRGEEIEKGTVYIEHGVIKAVGEEVELPYDAMVVDVAGKVLMPGMIDPHSPYGLDVQNENLPVTPYLDVYDALDPSRRYFEDALRDGLTSVHVIVGNDCVVGGIGRVVRPIGLTPDEMTYFAPTGLKISFGPKSGWDRMSQMVAMRKAFLELEDYLGELAEKKYEESLEKDDKKIDVGPDEARTRGRDLIRPDDIEMEKRNLHKLTRGELDAYVYCERASDVSRAMAFAKERGFFDRMTLVLGPDCFKAVDQMKELKRPVILDSELIYRERDPVTGELRETFVPAVYSKARVPFALQPQPFGSLAERYLNYQAARCVRNGISRKRALESITLNAAKALGLGERLGSLEPGKAGNVVVLTGDPLDFESWVETVYIDGVIAYDRKDDLRLKELFGEEDFAAKPGTGNGGEPKGLPQESDQAESGGEEAKTAAEDPSNPDGSGE